MFNVWCSFWHYPLCHLAILHSRLGWRMKMTHHETKEDLLIAGAFGQDPGLIKKILETVQDSVESCGCKLKQYIFNIRIQDKYIHIIRIKWYLDMEARWVSTDCPPRTTQGTIFTNFIISWSLIFLVSCDKFVVDFELRINYWKIGLI